MIAGLALAVDSQNIVGYQQYSLNAGQFYMVGVQFGAVGTAEGIPMKDLVTGTIPYGTQIQILKASGASYDIYTYIAEAYDESVDDFVPGWANGQEDMVHSGIVPVGAGCWVYPASNLTITFTSPL